MRNANHTGYVVYDGPSLIDHKPIVAIVTLQSQNKKTGNMAQIWILRADISPLEACKAGRLNKESGDYSICGDCTHRKNGTCYVDVSKAPSHVWRKYRRNGYPMADTDTLDDALFGRSVRIGAYGDPAAVPLRVWKPIVDYAQNHTGYTHQWNNRRLASDMQWRFLMASTESVEETTAAQRAGWRTFRAKYSFSPKMESETNCPASTEMGERTDCASCGLCDGSRSKKSITINVHGLFAKRQEARASA